MVRKSITSQVENCVKWIFLVNQKLSFIANIRWKLYWRDYWTLWTFKYEERSRSLGTILAIKTKISEFQKLRTCRKTRINVTSEYDCISVPNWAIFIGLLKWGFRFLLFEIFSNFDRSRFLLRIKSVIGNLNDFKIDNFDNTTLSFSTAAEWSCKK